MTIDASLQGAAGQQLVNKVASAFAIDPASAEMAVQGIFAALKFRIERNMLSRGGVADIAKLVGDPAATGSLSNGANLADPAVAADGNGILDVLIGNKHVSRGIAGRVAATSGLDAGTVERMLPAVAGVLIAELRRQSQPALQKLANDVPGLVSAGGSPLPMPPDRLPSADPTAPDDDATNDDARYPPRGGVTGGGGPLPIPGDRSPGSGRSRMPRQSPESDDTSDNPLDRLPDILRRGGGPSMPGGGSLEDVIRSVFGKLLGSNRGVVGTMIQMFVIRWIASLLRGILGRAFGRK